MQARSHRNPVFVFYPGDWHTQIPCHACRPEKPIDGFCALRAATSAALNEKALAAKTSNPEMGFMKHFRRIAEVELARAEFDRIDSGATQRDGSGV